MLGYCVLVVRIDENFVGLDAVRVVAFLESDTKQ